MIPPKGPGSWSSMCHIQTTTDQVTSEEQIQLGMKNGMSATFVALLSPVPPCRGVTGQGQSSGPLLRAYTTDMAAECQTLGQPEPPAPLWQPHCRQQIPLLQSLLWTHVVDDCTTLDPALCCQCLQQGSPEAQTLLSSHCSSSCGQSYTSPRDKCNNIAEKSSEMQVWVQIPFRTSFKMRRLLSTLEAQVSIPFLWQEYF